MKPLAIKKHLRKKLEEFAESLPTEDLKDIVLHNTIITGGAITSLLLGEKPKDYDIYFKDSGSAMTLVNYYLKKLDLGEDVLVEQYDFENIRGEVETRIRVFIRSTGFRKFPKEAPFGVAYISDNAISLYDKIQLVIRFYGDAGKIHDSYDFSHAKCWYDNASYQLYTPENALMAIINKSLIYEGSLYPLATLFRVRKFLKRGWTISAGQILKIAWQIPLIDFTDVAVLKDQLIGVDTVYMESLIKQLNEMPSDDLLDMNVIGNLLDNLFGDDEHE
jgi:hypothetical protein